MKTKSKTTAVILALFLGDIGIHKFYLGQAGQGIIYLLLCWTFIPVILSIIDIIHYLLNSLHSNNLARPNLMFKEDLYSVLLVEQKLKLEPSFVLIVETKLTKL